MSIYTATSQVEAYTLLAKMAGGDTLKLAPGIYTGASLSGRKFTSPVIITSADLTKPAVLTDLRIDQSTNLRFSQVICAALTSGAYITASSQLSFDHVEFVGQSGNTAEYGLWVRDGCSSVTVTNSEFHALSNGAGVVNSNGVTIAGCYFHDLGSDGIQSSGSSNVAFKDNLFTDFHPAAGDHPDAIQVFTSSKTVVDHDITISGNIITRGGGGISQGIFVTDEVGGMPMGNVNITDNFVLGGMYNSIMIAGVASGSIANNSVLGLPDMDSWIRVAGAPNVTVTGNTATAYVGFASTPPAGNALANYPSDGGAAALTGWVGKHEMPGFFGDASKFLTELGLPISTAVLNAAATPSPAPAPSPTPSPAPAPAPAPSPSPAPAPAPNPKPIKPRPRKIKTSMVVDGTTYTGTLTEKLT